MTLDLYGHMFADRLDEVADALDVARSAERLRDTTGTVRAIGGPSAFE